MKQDQWEGKIIPAQLSFLAIYSPPLGTTDETFREQVVFYHSRAGKEAKAQSRKKGARNTALHAQYEAFAHKEEENEKLRQIGLAQGMVDFARSFSNNQAVDSVDTEKSRIILHELEKGWWLLASIDLTRLPSLSHANSSRPSSSDNTPKIEYSSREVSPAPLLLQQVLTANRTFLLHHGPSLSDLYLRVNRDKFCGILDRFWGRFCRNWEVLLHGNPAVEVFGGLKLAAGGELGVGVGEEEWGSGEREVLEDLVRQTEGLVDLTVSRFGQAAPPEPDNAADDPSDKTLDDAQSGLPWLGCGHLPDASDGVIFGGTGAVTRASLRDVSSWVQEVYTYGEYAYGVRDNPHRQRRKRRRREPLPVEDEEQQPAADLRKKAHEQSRNQAQQTETKPEHDLGFPLPHDPRPQMHDRVASHDHATGISTPQVATHPGIPPPIVTAAEESLAAASRAAALPKQEPSREEKAGYRYGLSDKWTKYLTLGLVNPSSSTGSGASRSSSPAARPEPPRRTSSSSSKTIRPSNSKGSMRHSKEPDILEADEDGPMQTLDPAPDGHELTAQLARQRTAESQGHFLIGYRGDLDRAPSDDDPNATEDTQLSSEESEGARTMIRTLQIELSATASTGSTNGNDEEENEDIENNSFSDTSSTDDRRRPGTKRLRVLVYVHRPFIYAFLFDQRSPSLAISSFYATLHHHLRPLHRPLLKSTSLQQVAYRIADAHTSTSDDASINTNNPPYAPPKNNPVFDLVHDPVTLTTHTSIPNIPDPGTPAAEGFATTSTGRNDPPLWTRIEAINVHSQILNTLAATKPNRLETERTSKTSRGWWVVWLRIPSTPTEDSAASRGRDRYEECRQAFLVRKATDGSGVAGSGALGRRSGVGVSAGGGRVGSGMLSGLGEVMGLGSGASVAEKEDKEESQAVGWGLGIDARKYVEGLLSLNR